MPVSPTYPGVYVQELPSGTRTITGVASSVTAFIGRCRRGPEDEATLVSSWSEFERTFGSLWDESPLTYSVYQYFRSGGKDAVIVRVVGSTAKTAKVYLALNNRLQLRANPSYAGYESGYGTGLAAEISGSANPRFTLSMYEDVGDTVPVYTQVVSMDADDVGAGEVYIGDLASTLEAAVAPFLLVEVPNAHPGNTTKSTASPGTEAAPSEWSGNAAAATYLSVLASSPGVWGNLLYVTIDADTADAEDLSLFNLTVVEKDADGTTLRTEVFRNVSLDTTAERYVVTVVEDESELIAIEGVFTAAGAASSASESVFGFFPRPRETYTSQRIGALSGFASPITEDGADDTGISSADILGNEEAKTGYWALEDADIFNLLCIPPLSFESDGEVWSTTTNTIWPDVLSYCEARRAVAIMDCPSGWADKSDAYTGMRANTVISTNAAVYFPWVKIADPLRENRLGTFAPCGIVAGTIARTDAQRGVWKAPAGLDARVTMVRSLVYNLTDTEQGTLNPLGLNCIRSFPSAGYVVWGARTLEGSDRLASQWKYLPVRRVALFIEESLYRGMQWVVFEPNDEPLWAQIRMNVGTFMHNLFRQGAFQGTTPKDAYFVKCDRETTTQSDIDLGIVNIVVGFAPLKPAEFVIISLQQMAGQSAI